MAFDKDTRNKLARLVADCRRLLTDEFLRQCQSIYGIQPDGTIASLESLSRLDDRELSVARQLRERIDYLAANETGKDVVPLAIDRMLREQAFTVMNRLAAMRMAEARGLIVESVSKGMESQGFEMYDQIAGPAMGEKYERYCCFLFSMFDEIAIDLGVLFDRYSPTGLLFPKETALLELLALLNQVELSSIWAEDETIGWIYQYYNDPAERKAMRDASAAPRNSRELAVRNQFFTPRYVVEFLTDNTLGRIWYEMTKGQTRLAEQCRYLVRRPTEIFLAEGEDTPEQPTSETEETLSQEELLKQPVHIPHRPVKDPREIRLLDPACGSMHFGLYAFDLFEAIYEEAWDKGLCPALQEAYNKREDYLRDVPRLIIEHNIHGVDIDPRAVQIAGLSLWLRAQKTWKDTPAAERPRVRRSNIVCAEPMPGSDAMLEDFLQTLDPPLLGELVRTVFDKMQLAGEAGTLLKIEEEIRTAIDDAKTKWEKLGAAERDLFSAEELNQTLRPGTQQELTGVEKALTTDHRPLATDFFDTAEERIYAALRDYAESAEAGDYQRRLFAEDAAHGFAFIDLCRKRYDAVVMNPPFGSFSKSWTTQSKTAYPKSSNDILGAFVERGLNRLHNGGRLGAITSRTCFFLTTFGEWRRNVILKESAVRSIADLGQGVMDDAMVEAAAYVLESTLPTSDMTVFRAIADSDRQRALEACIDAYQEGTPDSRLFLPHQTTFDLLPDAPFVYWIDDKTLRQFETGASFEPDVGYVRVGLQTGDDPRYVRTTWEVGFEDTIFCYYPSNGDQFCRLDDPIVQAYFRRRDKGKPIWAFHVKSGASQPWHSPITLKLNYAQDGAELRNFRNSKGTLKSALRSTIMYYRPGFSWTLRAPRLYPYVVPGNCIPSVSRYMAFPASGKESEAVVVCSSRIASSFLRFYAEKFEWPKFLVEWVKRLPWPKLSDESKAHFEKVIASEVEQRKLAYQNHEPFHEFLLPCKVRDFSNSGLSLAFDAKSLLDADTEEMVADAFGFSQEQAHTIERDLLEAISYQQEGGASDIGDSSDNSESKDDPKEADSDFVLDYSKAALEEANLSYLLGTAFGRWDIRYATGERQPPELPDPFDPLPVCPPGMLQNADGLPAAPADVPDDYPLPVTWSGILVSDPGHPEDIVARVRDALAVIWGERSAAIEQEACEILGIDSLRAYFSRFNKGKIKGKTVKGFFESHLDRYSKSRRQAPIYWPLSTESGSYTLWIYYHRLNDDTLFACITNFVDPKIEQCEKDLSRLQSTLQLGQADAKTNDEIADLKDLINELQDFKEELQRIAKFWRPNLNDGVQITAAPLWKLFRLKAWQKKLKETCQKMEKGDYDWAHLSYSIWPNRVREKCKHDKSLAIAHDLESVYVEPPAKAKKKAKQT